MAAGERRRDDGATVRVGPLDRLREFVAGSLLEFRPWMLAAAVFLACAIGIAIMERSRQESQMWAQAQAPAARR
jgi:hypothetical protein